MTREEKLIRKTEQGDADAMEELITIYYPEILRYCLWHAPNRMMAEDAAQETFLKVIRYMDTRIYRGKFKPFLYKIAANTCIDMKRRKWTGEISLESLEEDMTYTEMGFEKVDDDILLRHLVRNLKSEWQEIVILRFGQDLTMREIAEITGIRLRTVQSRLRMALKQLEKELEKEEKSNEQKSGNET